jgi:hypothetical protein
MNQPEKTGEYHSRPFMADDPQNDLLMKRQ